MKSLTTILVILSFTCFAQVIKVADEKQRAIIEQYTEQYCHPDIIKFVQDGNGDWIVGLEVLTDHKFTFQRTRKGESELSLKAALTTELIKEGLAAQTIADMLTKYGELIDYVPVKDSVVKEPVPTKDGLKRNR